MNIIRLPQFLNIVDEQTKKMSHDELEIFIHEIARTLPEKKRDDFIELIKSIATEKSDSAPLYPKDDGITDIRNQISNIIPKLEKIRDGEVCLDSEFLNEWDDWYNRDEDEILFSDPDNLLPDIENAIDLVHKCIDMELFEDGRELCDTLCFIDVFAAGDYCDYDGRPLGIRELMNENLIGGNFESFMKEALYVTYLGNSLSCRAEGLYDIFLQFGYDRMQLESILQMGNHELPEFDEFLLLWIDYLGKQSDPCASALLKEAQSMIQDDFALLENARKYVNEHPELYLQLLEKKVDANKNAEMLDIGREAVDAVAVNLKIRSKIALWTAYYADMEGNYDIRELYWLEALRSDTSILNYMRIKFLPWNSEKYTEQIAVIVNSTYEESQKPVEGHRIYRESMIENRMSKDDYCAILFFEQKFDEMLKIEMLTTFIRDGMDMLLLLLYKGESYPVGMQAIRKAVIRICGFKKDSFYFGTTENDDKTDTEVFSSIFNKWKDTVTLSDAEVNMWIEKIEDWIRGRVATVMNENQRDSYRECAKYIAALGEVKESLGEIGAKSKIMKHYKTQYARRRAFHKELREFGMLI